MRVNLPFYVFYIFLIKYILLQGTYSGTGYDIYLEKYNKTYTQSSYIIFNSTDFKLDEEIYLKISGYFIEDYIEYQFFDDYNDAIYAIDTYINNIQHSITVDLKKENPTKYETKKDKNNNDGYEYYIRYYTIEKTKTNLKMAEKGNYLLILTNMDGFYDIENTKDNQGNDKTTIIIIVVVVVAVCAIVGIIYYCCCRKKNAAQMAQAAQNNQANSARVNINNNAAYNNNLGINNNVAYNNNPGYNYNAAYNNNYNNNPGYSSNAAMNANPNAYPGYQ